MRGKMWVMLVGWLAMGCGARAEDGPAKGGVVPLRVRVLEMKGHEWRTDVWSTLELVDHKGTVMIWTIDARPLGRLFGLAENEKTLAKGIPGESKVEPAGETKIGIWMGRSRNDVLIMAGSTAFNPVSETFNDSTAVEVSGLRPSADGVVASITIEDNRLIRVEDVTVNNYTTNAAGARLAVPAAYQVPEVVTSRRKGELDGAERPGCS